MNAQHQKPSFWHLLDVTIDALWMWPPDYIRSFFGPPEHWIPDSDYSEFTIFDLREPWRAIRYLADIGTPSIWGSPPPLIPEPLADIMWHPTRILQRPDCYGSYTSFPDEHWFFINGILTNADLAQLNAACLAGLFHRPITIIQNSTDGLLLDLVECSVGKEWYQNTESATVALPAIYDALKSRHKSRVVVICHSQGTIIMAVVLRALKAIGQHWVRQLANRRRVPQGVRGALKASTRPRGRKDAPEYFFHEEVRLDVDDFEPLTDDEWSKLEIYCFANCANEMRHHDYLGGRPVPWIENFGNENDCVARLGMLAPRPKQEEIQIEGPLYVHLGEWGHLLNRCYLLPIAEHQKPGRKRGGMSGALPFDLKNRKQYPGAEVPRLFEYINGGDPPELRPAGGQAAARLQ